MRAQQVNTAALTALFRKQFELCVNAVPRRTKVGVATVGACKGTKEALAAVDLLVCLHVPLFAAWLKEVVLYSDKRLAESRTMRMVTVPVCDRR